jgi:hypothetical protein
VPIFNVAVLSVDGRSGADDLGEPGAAEGSRTWVGSRGSAARREINLYALDALGVSVDQVPP